jgi:DNA-binding PadR family transcriptional regulator
MQSGDRQVNMSIRKFVESRLLEEDFTPQNHHLAILKTLHGHTDMPHHELITRAQKNWGKHVSWGRGLDAIDDLKHHGMISSGNSPYYRNKYTLTPRGQAHVNAAFSGEGY